MVDRKVICILGFLCHVAHVLYTILKILFIFEGFFALLHFLPHFFQFFDEPNVDPSGAGLQDRAVV